MYISKGRDPFTEMMKGKKTLNAFKKENTTECWLGNLGMQYLKQIRLQIVVVFEGLLEIRGVGVCMNVY